MKSTTLFDKDTSQIRIKAEFPSPSGENLCKAHSQHNTWHGENWELPLITGHHPSDIVQDALASAMFKEQIKKGPGFKRRNKIIKNSREST